MSIPLLIDCDPGQDDAIALLLAFASPEVEVLGVTTVAGNVPLSLTQKNARKVCELAGRRDIKVFAGCPRPLIRPLRTAEEVHGVTGLDGVDLPDPQMPLQSQHGVEFLIETLMQSTTPITLAALGPMTNVAVALIKEPRIREHLQEIVFMGGSSTLGNVTPLAEFNLYVDPHAAHVVLTSGVKLTMFGLNLTHQVITTPARLAALQAANNPATTAAAGFLKFYGTHDTERYGMPGGPLHDPCVIAYLIEPQLFQTRLLSVQVELCSEVTMGQTVVDRWGAGSGLPNVKVAEQVDVDGFYRLLTERLASL